MTEAALDLDAPDRSSRSRRGRPKDADPQAARMLLEATAALMRERDTLDVSFADIGRRAKLPPGLIGYHFGNKEGLLLALLERDVQWALSRGDALARTACSPDEKFKRHLTGMATAFLHTPYYSRLLNAMTRDTPPERVREIANRLIRPLVDAQSAIIDEGVAAGIFRPVDKMLTYFAVLGAVEALYCSRFILGSVFGIQNIDRALHEENAREIGGLLLTGLLKV
ncbi:MAG: TetR family transcriptional regulator [Sphingomonas sp.]|uniref:TetR family transcriptional regulator n=1 Tax=Sphingomonas sp. TaxID=28214 RepID=UPI001AC65EFF|nr:TetR family transcriptional regulator [Sphingomonas sp.]MBN8816520.1 TetR family transcriptional regulator [Sphingomonas sp.]